MAEGLGIPVIYFLNDVQRFPFDTRNHNHVEWGKKPEEVQNELRSALTNTLDHNL
jgi:hypothetical protein